MVKFNGNFTCNWWAWFILMVVKNELSKVRLPCSGVQIILVNDDFRVKVSFLWRSVYVRFGFSRRERSKLHAMKDLRFIWSHLANHAVAIWWSFSNGIRPNPAEIRWKIFTTFRAVAFFVVLGFLLDVSLHCFCVNLGESSLLIQKQLGQPRNWV